jgi:hypothetical protein
MPKQFLYKISYQNDLSRKLTTQDKVNDRPYHYPTAKVPLNLSTLKIREKCLIFTTHIFNFSLNIVNFLNKNDFSGQFDPEAVCFGQNRGFRLVHVNT